MMSELIILIISKPLLQISKGDMKKSYRILVKAINEIRIQLSTKNTLSAIDGNGRTFNTDIMEIHAKQVCLSIDDAEFHDWALKNTFARLWYCQDLRHSEILKLAIKNAMNKSPNDLLQRSLFHDETDSQRDQFVGFVSSHTTGKIVDAFHLRSFAVFHTTKGQDTIVTCMLTERNHILLNLQDRVLQLMQLIQNQNYATFSTSITNNFIGVDVQLSKMSMNGYKSMGFDVRSLTQDWEQEQLSWKCRFFRCRPQLILTTWCRVFPTRRPDTAVVSATSCDVGFFFSVSYVVSLPNCRHVVDRLRYIR